MAERSQHDPWAAGRLTWAELQDLLRRMGPLPVLPASAAALKSLGAGISVDPCELAAKLTELVRCDPAMAAQVLALASASGEPASSITEAIDRLGSEAVLRALSALAVQRDQGAEQSGGISRRELGRHCVAVALAAEMIARHLPGPIDPEHAYTAGLLHDVGKLALACGLPKSFHRAAELAVASRGDISDLERRVIGADHATVGHRLAEMWGLAPAIAEALWLHHQPPDTLPPAAADTTETLLVALADALARERPLGFSGNYVFTTPPLDQARQLHLPAEALEEIRAELPRAFQHCAGSPALAETQPAKPSPPSLDVFAAGLAVAEGRSQAEAFRHLRAFAGTLSGQSSVADALARIAELVAGVCDLRPSPAQPVLVYAVAQPGQPVEVLRVDGAAQPAWRAMKPASSPSAQAPADTAALLAALLAEPAELADWLDPSACQHLPLVCASRWVGGVILPAQAPSPPADATWEAIAAAAGMALAIVQGRCRAMLLSEQLAGASAALAGRQQAMTEERTLSAIGELASGAAHELNNPLAVISGRAQLMRDKAAGPEERKTWSLVADQAQRISDIITALMEIVSPPPAQPTRVEPFELLQSAAEAFSSSAHPQAASAKVDIEVDDGTPAAWADREQIHWVIVEAITNAATAADGPPHIRLSAARGEDGQSVLLTVSDDGPGMDADTLAKAFTPFFSLQRAGRRQGLGLPKARRYVENNAGKLLLTSRPGQGTQLRVLLPGA